MTAKKWPFPGDSPVARARKIALAYRAVAEQQQAALLDAANILSAVDRRLVAFTDPAIAADIDKVRQKLLETLDGNLVSDLDTRFRDWGETWHADVPVTYGPDDMITTAEAAAIVQLANGSLSRLRIAGRIKGQWDKTITPRGGWRFKVSDVWKLSTELRSRRNLSGPKSTDNITTSGSSDSE